MFPRDLLMFATMTTGVIGVWAASVDLDSGDYDVLAENEEKSNDDSSTAREVRCYCNQPECVPQAYLCRGRACFTELPSSANPALRLEHSAYGCLDESFTVRQCPAGFLCCKEDLCNHVDNPAMKNRLNKTLQVLVGDQRGYMGPVRSIDEGNPTTDGWFRTATIAVPICGLIVLLILASLAIRLLQPVPTQGDKLGPHRTPDNGPPLLGPPKVPLV